MEKSLKIMTVLVIAVLLFVPSISMATITENLYAKEEELIQVGNIKYKILSDTTVAVYSSSIKDVTKNGSGSSIGFTLDRENITQIVIPSNVEINEKKYTVIAVGNCAFISHENLTSVSLPNSITTIGHSAFNNCKKLTNITIPNKVKTISSSAFSYSGLTSITIPNSVTTIESSAFNSCKNLTKVVIPNNVTSLGTGAFAYTGIKEITLPNNITTIESAIFGYCKSLEKIVIPNKVKYINSVAFFGCDNLTNVTIPKSVERISSDAFNNSNKVVINTYKGSPAETFAKTNSIPVILLDNATNPTPTNNTKIGYVSIASKDVSLVGNEIKNNENVYTEMANVLKNKGYNQINYAYELSATGNIKNGVELTFDVGTNNNGRQAMILHKKSNGEYETFERTVEDGKVKITVTEFSPFMVAVAETKPSGGNSQGSVNTDNSKEEKKTENTEQTPTKTEKAETEKKSIGATTVKVATDNEPKTGTTDYTVIATILAIVSLAGIIILKLKK